VTVDDFARQLLGWYDLHGRKGLPWQRPRTAYRVWVSEVMLQQTQVATVIPYFERFMAALPDVGSLAAAPLDSVLGLWSGLGYYSRARNLHAAARRIVDDHGGVFPQEPAAAEALPGIGRSTAGAILAQAFGQRRPILDGNVKRVLTRYHAIAGHPGEAAVARQLWGFAERHTPAERVADYTQAIMDLGATLCARTPRCDACPLAGGCAAHGAGEVSRYPARRPRRVLPVRATTMLLLRDGSGAVLLERRPASGVWGGLWSLPELDARTEPQTWAAARGLRLSAVEPLAPLRHTFSHFQLDILALAATAEADGCSVGDDGERRWHPAETIAGLGLPAPVRTLLALADRGGIAQALV
jgi:A/G-specific adenine glycosylase